MKKIPMLSIAIFLLAALLTGCGNGDSGQLAKRTPASATSGTDRIDHGKTEGEYDNTESDVVKLTPEAAAAAGIETARASQSTITQSLSLPAEIRFDADRVANISPKVSGVIGRLYASEGDKVSRGDTLALIRSRELASLKAAWLTAETRKALANQALIREEKLFADKITSEADLQAARAEFEVAKAASDAAENELHAAGVSDAALARIATAADGDNANAYLTAPIAGTVVRRTVTLGETVSAGDAGADPLFTLVDDSVVWADIAVYKQDIGRIEVNDPVSLMTNDGEVLAQSQITLVLPVIDETSRTATARVIVDNADGRLRPGQFATAVISIGDGAMALQVPSNAIVEVEGRASVFVPNSVGFKPRAVIPGSEQDGQTVILSGLESGEEYVSAGAFTLKAQLEKDAFGDDHDH